jgi:uroporphyrinogen decarboxylase
MSTTTANFAELRVACFESRRADDMGRLIERFGGKAFVSPSLREVQVGENPAAVDFAHRLLAGEIEMVILMTGVGTRYLVAQVERQVGRERFLNALSDVVTVARGPKPVATMREFGLDVTHKVPEPNTWRDVLNTLDREAPVLNLTVGLQEYGLPNPSLVAGLEARGARVICVKVYGWDLPEDQRPLEANLRAIVAGERDAMMFTSAHQVVNVLTVAEQLGITEALREALGGLVVCSIGPTTSEMLRYQGWPVDLEPEHPKMGHLVQSAAEQCQALLERKRRVQAILAAPPANSPADERDAPWYDSPFMKACRREPCERTPIWLMRQAGRYMPEYRQVRAKTTFLELCKNPALCAEVMLTAVDRLGVDAAIIFSDLLPMLEPMGLELEFAQGEGPVIHNPVRETQDIDRVAELESVDALDFVMQTVKLTRAGLNPALPVIGFAGAPFTLASYTIEGGSSRNYLHTKTLMYRDEGAWHELMGRLARSVARYLNAQLAAGAQAVQLFDSWAGCLSPADYRRYVLPHTKAVIDAIRPGAPVINFATGNPTLLPLLSEAGGAVIGVDWRIGLDEAWKVIGHDKGIQGNLDPAKLFAPREELRRATQEVLRQAAGRPGHIFNLGHGVHEHTPVENVVALVEMVKEWRG